MGNPGFRCCQRRLTSARTQSKWRQQSSDSVSVLFVRQGMPIGRALGSRDHPPKLEAPPSQRSNVFSYFNIFNILNIFIIFITSILFNIFITLIIFNTFSIFIICSIFIIFIIFNILNTFDLFRLCAATSSWINRLARDSMVSR